MTAEPLSETPVTLADMAGVLAAREDVLGADVHHDAALEWRDPWLELAIDGTTIPPEILLEVGAAGFGISDTALQGYEFRVVEIKESIDDR